MFCPYIITRYVRRGTEVHLCNIQTFVDVPLCAINDSERPLILAPRCHVLSRLPLLQQLRGEWVEWRRKGGSMRYIRECPLSTDPSTNTQTWSSFLIHSLLTPVQIHFVLHQNILPCKPQIGLPFISLMCSIYWSALVVKDLSCYQKYCNLFAKND